MPLIVTQILAAAKFALNLYHQAVSNFDAVKENLSADDLAEAKTQLATLHAQYEQHYADAHAALEAAAQR